MSRRMTVLLLVVAGVLAFVAASAYRSMSKQRAAAITAQVNFAECQRLKQQIERFSRRPAQAAEHVRLAAETTGLIEKAARSAEIAPIGLTRITPEPGRRIGETVYKEKPTRVLLRKVTLRQLVTLIHGIIRSDAGLRAKSIRLTTPRQDDTGNLWNVELVFTYLIYDPVQSQR